MTSENSYFWTKEQEEILRKAYSSGGLSEAEKMIQGKAKGTIAAKACRMKLTNPKPRKNNP